MEEVKSHIESLLDDLVRAFNREFPGVDELSEEELGRLQRIIDIYPYIIWIHDYERLIPVLLNRTALDYYGFEMEEVRRLGFKFYVHITHPENQTSIQHSINHLRHYPDEAMHFAYQVKSRERGYRWTFAATRAITKDEKGLAKIMVSVTFDIDDLIGTSEFYQIFMRQNLMIGLNGNKLSSLTPRELEVLELICKEYTSTEIGGMLNISPKTVDAHRKNLIRKLEVKSSIGLAKYAFLFEAAPYT